jgi:hypothetical protein
MWRVLMARPKRLFLGNVVGEGLLLKNRLKRIKIKIIRQNQW